MKPKPRITQVYLCDNAFQDRLNKWNLIGIFSGDVLVEKLPARIRATLYIEVEMYDSIAIELELFIGKKRLATVNASIDSMNGSQQGTGVLAVPGLAFSVDKPSTLRVVAKIGDNPKRTVFRKDIRQGAVAA